MDIRKSGVINIHPNDTDTVKKITLHENISIDSWVPGKSRIMISCPAYLRVHSIKGALK